MTHKLFAFVYVLGISLTSLPTAGRTGEAAVVSDPVAPAETRLPGKFVWAELLTGGVPKDAAPFYAGVFGWRVGPAGEDYASVRLFAHGRPVAGIVHRADSQSGPRRARWVGFVSVPDVSAAVKASEDAGGAVLAPAAAGAGGAVWAVIADAEGAPLGLIAAAGGDDGDYAATDGEWIWPILFTRQPEAALDFYRKALGYDVHPERRTPLFQGDFILSRGVRARAGVMVLPSRTSGRSGWLLLVRVADLDATLAKVKTHGGRVLHGPTADLIGGRVAAAADPQGAVLGLVQTTAPAPAAVRVENADEAAGAAEPPAYEWRAAGFYDGWFDPAAIVLPPPMAFRGFGADGKPMPLLPAETRPSAGR